MTSILLQLQTLLDHTRGDLDVSLSFSIVGVSDSSCIDLQSYCRKELSDLVEMMHTWCPLSEIDTVQPIISSIEQGYSLPCVAIVRFFVKNKQSAQENLPGAMSTLILADLGTVSGGPLERSMAQLKSLILTLNEPYVENEDHHSRQHIQQPSFLSLFLEESFGGGVITCVVADIPKSGNSRNLSGFLHLLSAIRKIKNHPTPLLETTEMLELNALVEAHSKLELEHRSVRRELKQLQKLLKTTQSQAEALMSQTNISSMGGETQKWEYELELSRLNMDKLAVHERIRQCEIDLVCMEHERLLLLAEMQIKQGELEALEERLRSSVKEKETITREFTDEISGLSNELGMVQRKLEGAEKEKVVLQSNLNTASHKISTLEEKIAEAENAKAHLESQMESKVNNSAKQLEAKIIELTRLKSELEKTRENEIKLQRQLSNLETTSDTFKSTVNELEAKLSSLKLENVTLQAKLEVLSRKPQSPDVSRTIRAMEDKWQQERQAMTAVMDDLRMLIKEKEASRLLISHDSPTAQRMRKKTKVSIMDLPREDVYKKPARKAVVIKERMAESMSEEEDEDERMDTAKGDKRPLMQKSTLIQSILKGKGSDTEIATPKPKRGRPRKSNVNQGQSSINTTPKASIKGSTPKKMAIHKALETEKRDEQTNKNVFGTKNLEKDASPGKKKEPEKSMSVPKSLDKDTNVKKKAQPTVKMQKPKLTASLKHKENLHEGVTNKKINKLFEETAAVPEKIEASSKIATVSPTKVWKPSTFIPGVAARPKTSNATGNSIFSSLSFGGNKLSANGNDEGFRKRIKLPDRKTDASFAVASGEPLKGRRNVDHAAFSTIVSSFNIPAPGPKK